MKVTCNVYYVWTAESVLSGGNPLVPAPLEISDMASHNHQGLARDIGAGHADMGVQGVDVFVVQLGVGSGIHVGDEGFNPTPANGVSRLQALRHGKRCDETFQEAFSEFQKTA